MNGKRISRHFKEFLGSMWAHFAGDVLLMAIFFGLAVMFSSDGDIGGIILQIVFLLSFYLFQSAPLIASNRKIFVPDG